LQLALTADAFYVTVVRGPGSLRDLLETIVVLLDAAAVTCAIGKLIVELIGVQPLG
jgi:hypothetical protein